MPVKHASETGKSPILSSAIMVHSLKSKGDELTKAGATITSAKQSSSVNDMLLLRNTENGRHRNGIQLLAKRRSQSVVCQRSLIESMAAVTYLRPNGPTTRWPSFLGNYDISTRTDHYHDTSLHVASPNEHDLQSRTNIFTLAAELGFLPILTRRVKGIMQQIQPPVSIGEIPMNVITASPTSLHYS